MGNVVLFLLIGVVVTTIGFTVKGYRIKGGISMVILGLLSIIIGPGMIIGVPMILVGGMLLFT
ncbi:MAG: hypothetical protein P9M15_04880 [Candidatus Electryoneaceae bacterium]|nr:hypothetical protein [Candidatus Electryoneaceae bacterium]